MSANVYHAKVLVLLGDFIPFWGERFLLLKFDAFIHLFIDCEDGTEIDPVFRFGHSVCFNASLSIYEYPSSLIWLV
jgi:hypothetical protein